ncbi:MAG: hypothetical protein JWR59_2518 [Brevundimonas sp.]|nr:hypothetical protein [Brevundimonas sp.]
MKQSETEIAVEIEQQVFAYFDLCANFETVPSVLGFAQHLKESYE